MIASAMRTRGIKNQYECKHCGSMFVARVADRQRGWALYCSKNCKQHRQEDARKIWKVLRS